MTDPVDEARNTWAREEPYYRYPDDLPHARYTNGVGWVHEIPLSLVEAIRQQERSRYEGLLRVYAAFNKRGEQVSGESPDLSVIEGRIMRDSFSQPTDYIGTRLTSPWIALAGPAPSPSTEDVCEGCGGTGRKILVTPGALGLGGAWIPCPSCTSASKEASQ